MARHQDPYSTPIPQSRQSQPIFTSPQTAHGTPPSDLRFRSSAGYASDATAVTSPPVTTTRTDASGFAGRWENPAFQKLQESKLEKGVRVETWERIWVNSVALAGLWLFTKTVFHSAFVALFGVYFKYFEFLISLVFFYNLGESAWRFLKPSENFANLPLTPIQRKMAGLDPRVKSITTDSSISAPHYSKSSPKSRSDHREYPPTRTVTNPTPFTASPAPTTVRLPGFFPKTPAPQLSPFSVRKSPLQRMEYEPIGNSIDLDRLLKEDVPNMQRAEPATPTPLHTPAPDRSSIMTNASGFLSAASTAMASAPPTFSPYQTAIRSTPTASTVGKGDNAAGGAGAIIEPEKVLSKLKIEPHMHDWTQRMRQWIAYRMVVPLVSKIAEIDAELEKQGWAYLNTASASYFKGGLPPVAPTDAVGTTAPKTNLFGTTTTTPSTNLFGSSKGTGMFGGSGFGSFGQPPPPQPPQSLMDLAQRFATNPVARERLKIEKYLNMDGFNSNSRDYVLERVKTLAQGVQLMSYRWNGGADTWGDGKPWSEELPTDAELVMHLFCTFMDLAMPGEDALQIGNHPFTHKYFVPVTGKPDPKKPVLIRQAKKSPPHFQLIVCNTTWDVFPKRTNVFQTLVLFTYHIHKEHAGYLGLLNLSSRAIDLMSVVEE